MSMGEGRKERSDKKIRVNSPLSKSVHDKLDKLSVGCAVSKTAMGSLLIELALNNDEIVNQIQEMFRSQSRFRIIPSRVNGILRFVYAERLSKSYE